MKRWWVVPLLLLLFPVMATAQDDDSAENSPESNSIDFPNALYLGQLTFHLRPESQGKNNANNQLIGLVYKGIFFARFDNSFHEPSHILGLQRQWAQYAFRGTPLDYSFGYRVGIIEGYDERTLAEGGNWPVIPFASLLTQIRYGKLALEFSYTGVIISAALLTTF